MWLTTYSLLYHIVLEWRPTFSLGQDVIDWRQSITTGATLREKDVVRQYAQANNCILASDSTVLDATETENNLQWKKVAEK